MKGLTPETRVGLLVIATGVALLYLAIKASGVIVFGGSKFISFDMRFVSVSGVEPRSKVKLSGVEIGYVSDIILEDGKARLKVQLVRPASIRKNAVATIRASGLLGEKHIEIIQGSHSQPWIKDGDTLENTQEPTDIGDMLNKLGSSLDDIKSVTSSLKSAFGTMSSANSLKNILENVDVASGDMRAMLVENRESLKTMLANFSSISKDFAGSAPKLAANLEAVFAGLEKLIEDNGENLTAGVANLKELTEQFKGILKENRENLKTTLDNVASASSKIDNVMASVKKMSESMESITGKIEQGKGTIGKLVTDEDVYDNLNNTLTSAGKFLNKSESIRLSLGFRAERQFDMENTKSFLSLRIHPREDKSYLLEISEDVRRSDLGTTRNTINSLLYTALIEKRISDVIIRGGLIESSAGFGLDYYLLGDRLKASAEIFNFGGYDNNSSEAQVKAQLRWNAYKYIYFYLGGDELLNEYYRTFLVGGGIMFDEDDLKMAISLL